MHETKYKSKNNDKTSWLCTVTEVKITQERMNEWKMDKLKQNKAKS